MKEINISLYGGDHFFSKKGTSKVAALITSCSRCEECQIYKDGKCVLTTMLNRGKCPYGSNRRIEGPTSRAKSYSKFLKTYKDNPLYDKVDFSEEYIFVVGEDIIINLPNYSGLGLYKGKRYSPNELWIRSSFYIDIDKVFTKEINQISKSELTPNLLYQIFDAKPRTIFDNAEIKSYKSEFLRDFQIQLEKRLPDIFHNFIKVYSQFDKEINYIGKEAFLRSLKSQIIIVKGISWEWNQENKTLICLNPHSIGSSGLLGDISGMHYKEILSISLNPKDDYIIKITDNKQVDENTEFSR